MLSRLRLHGFHHSRSVTDRIPCTEAYKEMHARLVACKEAHGDWDVPHAGRGPAAGRLGGQTAGAQAEVRPPQPSCMMAASRVEKLERLGFVWKSGAASSLFAPNDVARGCLVKLAADRRLDMATATCRKAGRRTSRSVNGSPSSGLTRRRPRPPLEGDDGGAGDTAGGDGLHLAPSRRCLGEEFRQNGGAPEEARQLQRTSRAGPRTSRSANGSTSSGCRRMRWTAATLARG
jgi:hypothetical protein